MLLQLSDGITGLSFIGIDIIYLRNITHEVKVQEAMTENWIRDEQISFPHSHDVPGSLTVSAQNISSKYTNSWD